MIFDFDGVLVDSNRIKRQAYFDVFSSFGPVTPLVEQALADPSGGDRWDVIERIVRLARPALSEVKAVVVGLVREYNRICEAAQSMGQERAGASVLLSRWAQRFALYVNSATPEEPLRRVVERRGWTRHFQGVFGRPTDKVGNIQRALQQEGLSPVEAVMIGDGRLDLEAAAMVGCHFLALASDGNDFVVAPRLVPALQELEAQLPAHWTNAPTAR